PRPKPVERPSLLGPEAFGIIVGALPELLVLALVLDVRGRAEFRGRRKEALLLQDAGNVGIGGRAHEPELLRKQSHLRNQPHSKASGTRRKESHRWADLYSVRQTTSSCC